MAIDFGSGATVAYAGGRGNLGSILRAASSTALEGLKIDSISNIGQLVLANLPSVPSSWNLVTLNGRPLISVSVDQAKQLVADIISVVGKLPRPVASPSFFIDRSEITSIRR